MKKYNVFKVLLIALAITIIISFIVPSSTVGYYTSGIEKGTINPINLVDSISNGLTSFSVFIGDFIFILCIGIFYAILRKTGKYDTVINNTAYKFKNKKGLFIVTSVLMLGILTSIMGSMLPMLVFVPAFISISKKLGYDSKTSILSTIGAIILGSAGSLYTSYTNQILQTTTSSNIIAKVIVLIIGLGSIILYTILSSKPKDTKLEKQETKKALPVIVAFDVIIILLILGMIPWGPYFEFKGFSEFHTMITDFKVLNVSLFNSIIGSSLTAFGEWGIYNVIVLLIVISVVLSIIYRINIDELLESISSGIRKSLSFAIILIFANLILVGVYNSGFFTTIISGVASMKDKLLSGTTISLLSSFVYPDYTYASQFTLSTITYVITDAKFYIVLALIFQVIYSLFLLISPTSILILLGLQYEGVSYKEWIKYVYKYFLGLFIVLFMILMIASSNYITTLSYVVLAIIIVVLSLFIVLSVTKKDNKGKIAKETKKEDVKVVEVKENKKTTTKNASTTKKVATQTKKESTKSTAKKSTTKTSTSKKGSTNKK